jgi:hypothetical protein
LSALLRPSFDRVGEAKMPGRKNAPPERIRLAV